MKTILTYITKKIVKKDYIHIPKNKIIKTIIKKCLNVKRIRGRGGNWKAINKAQEKINQSKYPYSLKNRLNYDGGVPLKYASYLYVSLE